jgi:DNA-binding NarL/FixJ family response regulator
MHSKSTPQFSPAEQAVIISHNCLTPTEVEVLQRVADKGSVREAAQAICRSETTLKRELAAIRAKLGVRTTLQVVVWAVRQGVIR